MPVDWISIAVLSAASFGLTNVFDSHLISRGMPSLRSFQLLVGIWTFFSGLILLFLFPWPEGIGTLPLIAAVTSGLSRATAVAIMFYALQREEVSRVVPVVGTYPVFVALIAILLLGETLSYLQWIAIITVIAGAVTVSIRRDTFGSATWLGKSFFLLFGASLLVASGDVTAKYALNYISFWNMNWITGFCMTGVFLLVSLRRGTLRELGILKKRKPTITLFVFNQILSVIASLLLFLAIELGPVSLVSTIASSRPIFVITYAFIFSRVSPKFIDWQPGKGMLVFRIIAIIMIVGGISIIYLT